MRAITVAMGIAVVAATASAGDWTQWGGNGHWYRVVETPNGINWANAELGAEALGGTLATLTSAEENAFAFTLVDNPSLWYNDSFGSFIGPWIGLRQPAGSQEPGGGWEWVTGEAFSYNAWASGEPNNSGNTENRGHFFGNPGAGRLAKWNDITDTVGTVRGYVVEATVPVPGAIGLAGVAGLVAGRRRRG